MVLCRNALQRHASSVRCFVWITCLETMARELQKVAPVGTQRMISGTATESSCRSAQDPETSSAADIGGVEQAERRAFYGKQSIELNARCNRASGAIGS
jgi:hypothetical protein